MSFVTHPVFSGRICFTLIFQAVLPGNFLVGFVVNLFFFKEKYRDFFNCLTIPFVEIVTRNIQCLWKMLNPWKLLSEN